MNNVKLYGRVATDIELEEGKKYSYVRFNVAVADGVDDKGEKKTQFVPCIIWNERAEVFEEYVKKGDRILIDGRINISNYEDEEGVKRNSFQIIVNNFEFIETKSEADEKKSSKRKR